MLVSNTNNTEQMVSTYCNIMRLLVVQLLISASSCVSYSNIP